MKRNDAHWRDEIRIQRFREFELRHIGGAATRRHCGRSMAADSTTANSPIWVVPNRNPNGDHTRKSTCYFIRVAI